jgi:hypothetical protein
MEPDRVHTESLIQHRNRNNHEVVVYSFHWKICLIQHQLYKKTTSITRKKEKSCSSKKVKKKASRNATDVGICWA